MTPGAYLALVTVVFIAFAGIIAYSDFSGRDLRRKHAEKIRAAVKDGHSH